MTQTLVCKNVTCHDTPKGMFTQSGSGTRKRFPENQQRQDFSVQVDIPCRNTISVGFSRRWRAGVRGRGDAMPIPNVTAPTYYFGQFVPKIDLFVAYKEIHNSFETQSTPNKKGPISPKNVSLRKDPIVNALCQCMLWVDCDAFLIGIARCEWTLIRTNHK